MRKRNGMGVAPLAQLLATFSKQRVLVVGDAILDVAYFGRRLGASVENPKIFTNAHERVEYSYGGASLVVRNLLALGAQVDYLTAFGDDANYRRSSELSSALPSDQAKRLRFRNTLKEKERLNTVKQRFWVNGKLEYKWNYIDDREIGIDTQKEILFLVEQGLSGSAALVIADNRHGVLASALIPRLLVSAKKIGVPVYVDSQVAASGQSNHRSYRGAHVVCFNEKEAKAVAGEFDPAQPEVGLRKIRDTISAEVIVVKLGKNGSVALVSDEVIKTPPAPVTAVDTTGAGDAFLAALAVTVGAPWGHALQLANLWAGLSTTVQGPNPPERSAFAVAVGKK